MSTVVHCFRSYSATLGQVALSVVQPQGRGPAASGGLSAMSDAEDGVRPSPKYLLLSSANTTARRIKRNTLDMNVRTEDRCLSNRRVGGLASALCLPGFRNQILSHLPPESVARLKLQPVTLPVRAFLEKSERGIQHIFFIESGVGSMTAT